jgi:hypothetical protein
MVQLIKIQFQKALAITAIVLCMSDMNLPGLFTFTIPLLKLLAKRGGKEMEKNKS